ALLGGTGTIGTVSVTSSGVLAPGPSPGVSTTGILNTGSLTFADSSCQYDVTIAGPNAGTQYSQLNVTGNIILNNASLVPQLVAPPIPVLGQTYTIIKNLSNNPVNGTFGGLPEGSAINFSGVQMNISYHGNGGNDVVLTVTALPVFRVTGFPSP